jgi:hypothetical protein
MSSTQVRSETAIETPRARDADWPDWYAEYIVRERAGKQLPS